MTAKHTSPSICEGVNQTIDKLAHEYMCHIDLHPLLKHKFLSFFCTGRSVHVNTKGGHQHSKVIRGKETTRQIKNFDLTR